MSEHKPSIFTPPLDAIFERATDYPRVYTAAMRLKPFLTPHDLPGQEHVKAALGANETLHDAMVSVDAAAAQLQKEIADLKKSVALHPENAELKTQLEETRLVSAALTEAISIGYRVNGAKQPNGNHKPAARSLA